jgi:D-serine deaminase-like pyridoxal phosphate-dependent protein
MRRTEIGMSVDEVSTPAVVVDLDVVERNLQRMTAYCSRHGLKLRPHAKTHKSIEAGKMQLALGAVGLTVAKVGEAEVMIASGATELLVAHPIVGDEKIERLADLCGEARIIVAIDSLRAAEGLARVARKRGVTFGVLVEFDSGSHRCGVAPGETAARLGEAVSQLRGVELRGLFTYFGSVWGEEAQRSDEITRIRTDVERTLDAYQNAGLNKDIVSAGSTPSAMMSHTIPGITEIRPGTYIYNDLNTFYQGLCGLEDCAARVITTVVSNAVQGQVIVDAGSKTLSSDLLGAGSKQGYGLVMEGAGTLTRLNEEHGYLAAEPLGCFEVGRVLETIPNHVCTCINMHDEVLLARGQTIVGTWRVDARGKVR